MDRPVPEKWHDRLAGMADRNGFELALAAWWVAGGLLLIVASFSREFDPSPSFGVLPDWVAAVVGAPLMLGGVGLLIAMFCRWTNLADRWRLERASLTLAAVALACFGAIVLWYRPTSIFPAGMAFCMVAGAWLRIRASRRHENAIRNNRGD